MLNRSSSNSNNDNTNKGNYIKQSLIGGTASYAGLWKGIELHRSAIHYFAKPSIISASPYALGTALAIGAGLYGVNRFGSVCIGNGTDMNSESKARSLAAIAATAFGTSTLAGWSLSNQHQIFWRQMNDKLLKAGFSVRFEPMLASIPGATFAGAGLVIGLGSVALINIAQNQYKKLQGANLKEKAKFMLFSDRSNRTEMKPLQTEVIKDLGGSVPRKI